MSKPSLSLSVLALAFACQANAQSPPATVITGAQIADGTAAPLRKASVRIVGDRIARIGKFKPAKNDRVIDGKGLVLAPGFIDIHNHSDEGLEAHPLAETQISQGITTVILGPDGGSPWPIGEWLEKRRKNPPALNLAVLVGHATVRKQVMGEDYKRAATPAEIEKMAALVDQAMNEGAIGLSSGLEYEVGSYSSTDELVALARVAAKHGGFYMTHIRDEADKAFDALNEEISISERARIPVEHSHIKLGTVGVWGKAADYTKIIEHARRRGVDFLADCYPYDAWHSNLKVLVPNKQYEDPKSVEKALADVGGAAHVTITDFSPHPQYEGKNIEELARDRSISPIEMYVQLIREGNAAHTEAGVIGQSMIEPDIKAFYQQPWVMVASDGGIGMKHPRGAGTFPRVLGRFVREKHWLTLPEAVRKMTSLPARRLGWKDRGVIREGAVADLVLFNPRTVTDRSTFEKPFELSVGIEKVFVNGALVWSEGKPTGALPGIVLSLDEQTKEESVDYLYGLYYAQWGDQETDLAALVISPDGKRIPPKSNDPDAPTEPGFYIGERHFKFAWSRFSPRGFSFRTVRVDGTEFSFRGRFGREDADIIPDVPYLAGVLTEKRNSRVSRKKKIHFGHAVVF